MTDRRPQAYAIKMLERIEAAESALREERAQKAQAEDAARQREGLQRRQLAEAAIARRFRQERILAQAQGISAKEAFLYKVFASAVAQCAIDANIPTDTLITEVRQPRLDIWQEKRTRSKGGYYVPWLEPDTSKGSVHAWSLQRETGQHRYEGTTRTIGSWHGL